MSSSKAIDCVQDGLIVSKRMDIVVGVDAQRGKGTSSQQLTAWQWFHSKNTSVESTLSHVWKLLPGTLKSAAAVYSVNALQVCIWLPGAG